jgi:hypothetical protein
MTRGKSPTKAISLPLPRKRRGVEAHLVYRINKGLSILPTEVTNRVYLVLACEDRLNQWNDLVRRGDMTNQAFVGRCAKVNMGG